MKHNREYQIAWQGLKPGEHTFVYDVDNEFMNDRNADSSFKDWNAQVTLKFDKKTSFFLLHFDISGHVTVPCDRCGDDFKLGLWDEFNLIIKLTGDDNGDLEDEDDVVFIPRSETVIDISTWIYEYVMLSVPLQHIHPNNANGEPGCNPQALQLLTKLSEPEEPAKNPIWKDLEKLKKTEEQSGT
jgi:uncharacterized metal-binding protein YceD (DUF177 family)